MANNNLTFLKDGKVDGKAIAAAMAGGMSEADIRGQLSSQTSSNQNQRRIQSNLSQTRDTVFPNGIQGATNDRSGSQSASFQGGLRPRGGFNSLAEEIADRTAKGEREDDIRSDLKRRDRDLRDVEEKPFQSSRALRRTLSSNEEDSFFSNEDVQKTFDASTRTLRKGLDEFNLVLQEGLNRSEESSIQSVERTLAAFKKADSLLEEGIDDIRSSERELQRSFEESRLSELGIAETERERATRTLDQAREEAREQFQSSIAAQEKAVADQRVRDETFSGLRGGFGSSAGLENIDRAEQQGREILSSLTKSAARSEESFAQQFVDAGRNFLDSVREINADSDLRLAQLNSDTSKQVLEIQKSRSLNETQKIERINSIVSSFEDRQTAFANAKAGAVINLNTALAANVIELKKQERELKQQDVQNQLSERQFGLQEAGFKEGIRQFEVGAEFDEKKFGESVRQFGIDRAIEDRNFTESQRQFAIESAFKERGFELDSVLGIKNIQLKQQDIAERQRQFEEDMSFERKKFDISKNLEQQELNLKKDKIKEELEIGKFSDEDVQRNIQYAASVIPTGSVNERQEFQRVLNDAIERGDVDVAKSIVMSKVKNNMKNERLRDIDVVLGQVGIIENSLNEYIARGGDTNLISGNLLKANEKVLKQTNDPELSRIANEIAIAVQTYTNIISGAQFTEAEAARYERAFPNISASEELNAAKIASIKNVWGTAQNDAVKSVLGKDLYTGIFGEDGSMDTKSSLLKPQSNDRDFSEADQFFN